MNRGPEYIKITWPADWHGIIPWSLALTRWCPMDHTFGLYYHYIDVIMTTKASQITSLTAVYSTVYSDADQRKHQSSASLAFVWEIHRDRRIPRTKGQLRGKWFHLLTSSWFSLLLVRVTVCHIRYINQVPEQFQAICISLEATVSDIWFIFWKAAWKISVKYWGLNVVIFCGYGISL